MEAVGEGLLLPITPAAGGRSGALLLEGEPGVGKTTLLEAAGSTADGFT